MSDVSGEEPNEEEHSEGRREKRTMRRNDPQEDQEKDDEPRRVNKWILTPGKVKQSNNKLLRRFTIRKNPSRGI